MTPLSMLTTRDVMARYPWVRDVRSARRVIAAAGGRRIAGRLAVRLDRLAAWEDGGADLVAQPAKPINNAPTARSARRRRAAAPAPLPPDWWKE